MKTVWKYELVVTELQTIRMPTGALVLAVDKQGCSREALHLWVLVDPSKPSAGLDVWIRGTGQDVDIPEYARYIGTVLLYGGNLVWHIWAGWGP